MRTLLRVPVPKVKVYEQERVVDYQPLSITHVLRCVSQMEITVDNFHVVGTSGVSDVFIICVDQTI